MHLTIVLILTSLKVKKIIQRGILKSNCTINYSDVKNYFPIYNISLLNQMSRFQFGDWGGFFTSSQRHYTTKSMQQNTNLGTKLQNSQFLFRENGLSIVSIAGCL